MWFILIPVFILSAVFLTLHFYLHRKFKFWKNLSVPYINPTPIFGNFKDCVFQKVSIGEQLQEIYRESTDKHYIGILFFYKPSLLIRDLNLVKNVLVKDSQNFVDRAITLNEETDPVSSKSLFATKGQRWRHLRTKLSPVFSSGKIKKMFSLVDTCGKELAECLDRATVGDCHVDVTDVAYRYTADAIGSCAFGINGYSLKDPQAEFFFFIQKIFTYSLLKGLTCLLMFLAPKLASTLKLKFLDDDTANYLRRTTWSTMEYRERNGIERNDFLDCMMELRNRGNEGFKERIQNDNNPTNNNTIQLNDDDIVAQSFVFLAAGFESSGCTLSCGMYEFALHPEIQHKLRTEILTVMNKHNGQLTYDGIQEMAYLDMVVSEVLRKYPILPFLDRMCLGDYELPAPAGNGTVTVPAGTAVYISVLALHHDPQYFPEPEKFDPDRFTEENKKSRPHYSYIPFGEGPRICIGMRFGQMAVKAALCHILSRFEVAPCEETPGHIDFDPKAFELKPNRHITLSIKRTNL